MMTDTMRAVRMHEYGSADVLQIERIAVPQPAAGEVLVRVEAAGVNWADVHRRRGLRYPEPTPLPHIVGAELYGTVVALGEGVTDLAEGDRVFATPRGGAYAEYAVVERPRVIPAPPGLDPHVGLALLIQGLTAIGVLGAATRLQPGFSVLVQGAAGGVGALATQLARVFGAGLVIAAVSSPEKAAWVRELGADAVVDTRQEGWDDTVRRLTGGRGVDLVLEMSGGDVYRRSVDLLAPFGELVAYGSASGEPLLADLQPDHRPLSVHTFFLGAYLSQPGWAAEKMAALAGHVARGELQVHVNTDYALEDVRRMHRDMEARRTTGKLVVRI